MGAKATDTRTQSKTHGVSIDSCGHLFVHLKKFLYGQRQGFQIDREAEMSIKQYSAPNLRGQTSTAQGYKSRSHDMTNVSVSEVNMLKNSSKLAVSVPINLSIKFVFVSVKGPRGIYFVDMLHKTVNFL